MTFEENYGIKPIVVIATVLGVFMAILDSSVVNVAIPKMMSVFATTQNTISWVITVYMLTTGMLTPVSGYIGDRFGYTNVYMVALGIFTLGSALCGAAWSVGAMIVFRVIQGIGGAMLIPISMSIMFSQSKPEKRGAIMGIWGIAMMFAPAFGPTLSGYFVEYLNWRLVFYINIPFGILDLILARMYLPKFKPKAMFKFDLPGFLTAVGGFFCLLYALSDAPDSGWTSLKILSLLVGSVILLSMFVVLELTSDHPMLNLRLMKIWKFLISTIASSLITMAMLGALFLLPVFLQNGIGLSPFQAGLLTMPGALITAIMMPISGALFDKIGARPLAIVGMSVMLVASFLLTNLNLDWAFFSIMIVYMIRASGMGLTNMPISTAGMNAVPSTMITQATALQNTVRNVAGSMGTAMLSTVMQTHSNDAFSTYMQNLSNHTLQGISSYGMTPTVQGISNPNQMLHLMILLKQLAFQSGTQYALKVSVLITLVAFVAIFFLGKKEEVATGSEHAAIME